MNDQRPALTPLSRQRGVVMFVAMIVMVVMTLAGLALLRQMGIGTSIAGNVAFKESATSVADRGIEEARSWVLGNAGILASDSAVNGYFSSWGGSIDPNTFNWDPSVSGLRTADQAGTGNTTRFIVHRLCAVAGLAANDPAQHCSIDPTFSVPTNNGGAGYGGGSPLPTTRPFYRITTRVEGPRNTVSYTQVLIN